MIDVNVAFTGFTSRSPESPPRDIIGLWLAEVIDLVVCPHWIEEASDVFGRPRLQRWLEGRGPVYIDVIRDRALCFDDPVDLPYRCLDPDDEYLAALAANAGAILVTGDGDVMEVQGLPVPLASPRGFLDGLGQWIDEDYGDRR